MMSGLLLQGGTVLDPEGPLRQADVRVEGDTITEVEAALTRVGERVVDAGGAVVMPGLVNAHTHSGQSLEQGTTPNLPLDLWMMWAVYGGVELSSEDAYTAAATGALEMLQTGCTAVLDHANVVVAAFAEHAEALMAAYDDVGMRAVVAPLVQDRDFFESLPLHLVPLERPQPLSQGEDPAALAALCAAFVEHWRDRHPRLVPALGPSAPQRCSDEFLARMSALVRELGASVHTHLLETKSQAVATRARYGRSVVEHLDELGLLGSHASFAHGVWLTDEEYRRVLERGSVLVHSPISNLRCGSGVMPLQRLLPMGLPVALGSDGAASNDNQNMFETMKIASLVQTLYGTYPSWPEASDIWRMCVVGGATALGQKIGRVVPGAKADLVVMRSDSHATVSKEGLVTSIVFSEHGESVDIVIVGGEIVYEGGRSTRVDEAQLRARGRDLNDRLHHHVDRRREAFGSVEEVLSRMLEAVEAEELELPHRRLDG